MGRTSRNQAVTDTERITPKRSQLTKVSARVQVRRIGRSVTCLVHRNGGLRISPPEMLSSGSLMRVLGQSRKIAKMVVNCQ
jgi:hypothetical protein